MEKYLISEAFDKLSDKKLKENLPDDKEECKRLAMNPSTSSDILSELANHDNFVVRKFVALNDNTPVKVLLKLAKDSSYVVRMAVAENSSTPPDLLSKLANDESWEVRDTVGNNPNTPADVLRKLLKDEDEYIQSNAKETLDNFHPYEFNQNDFEYTDDEFDDWE